MLQFSSGLFYWFDCFINCIATHFHNKRGETLARLLSFEVTEIKRYYSINYNMKEVNNDIRSTKGLKELLD